MPAQPCGTRVSRREIIVPPAKSGPAGYLAAEQQDLSPAQKLPICHRRVRPRFREFCGSPSACLMRPLYRRQASRNRLPVSTGLAIAEPGTLLRGLWRFDAAPSVSQCARVVAESCLYVGVFPQAEFHKLAYQEIDDLEPEQLDTLLVHKLVTLEHGHASGDAYPRLTSQGHSMLEAVRRIR